MFHRSAALYIHNYSISKAAEQRHISSKKKRKSSPKAAER
jgi:hypothetical protein